MNERGKHRRPATFRLDDSSVVVVDAEDATRPARGIVQITPENDPAQLPVPIEAPAVPRRGFGWGAMFWGGIAGLVLLGVGLGVTQLIEDLFARSESLGILGLASAFAATLALVVVASRELLALARLAGIPARNAPGRRVHCPGQLPLYRTSLVAAVCAARRVRSDSHPHLPGHLARRVRTV